MRDPAVLAVFALRVTAAEFATLASGAPIVRLYWPPVPCRGSVVGLHVGGRRVACPRRCRPPTAVRDWDAFG